MEGSMSEAVGLKELLRRKIDQTKGADEFKFVADKFEIRDSTGRVHLSSDDLHVPGAKDDKAKPMAGELIIGFPHALSQFIEVATYGAYKYTRGGYLHVSNAKVRYLDAAMRHLLAYGTGQMNDRESGLPHLAHVLWNIAAIIEIGARNEKAASG